MSNTIELYGYGIQGEALAAAAITPGMLVERTSAANDTVQAHGSAGGHGNAHFAVENEWDGAGIDTNYATGANVKFRTYSPGAGVNALVAAGATAITKAAWLQSAGDGTLAIAATGDYVVAQAREAVDNSGGSTAVRIHAEVVGGFYLP